MGSCPFPLIGLRLANMPVSQTPEIISPEKAAALDTLERKQALEWQSFTRLEDLATLMDARFKIPGLPLPPLGVDSIIGLIPGIGDTISLLISAYIILSAARLKAGRAAVFQMTLNIFLDWLIGLIPIIGDLFDWGWRGNLRNTAILRDRLEARWQIERDMLLTT